MTPQVGLVTQQYQTSTYDVLVYKVTTQSGPLHLRSGTGTNYKILGKYRKGSEVIVLNKTTSSWYEVTCPDGRHGYMASEYLTYVRTDQQSQQTNVGFRNEVIEPRQLRDQPFRIYRVVPELTKVTVYARHIFYDLLDNMVKKLEPSASAVGVSVVQNLSSSCLSAHDFNFYSDLTSTAEDVSFENINPVEAMLGEGGITEKYGAELARDWFDVFLVRRVGHDSDVQVREKKNLTGISYDVDETDVVTRIMPTGEDTDGNILYLPELYIDSPNIGAYTHPKWIHLAVSEAREVAEGDDYKSLTACYADMRKAAQAEFAKGCDLPTISLKVDFINCTDAEEYKQYSALSNIFLGDAVRVIARRVGVEVTMRMTQYTYDCLTEKYTAVTLGTVSDALEGSMISARQLASGSINGTKLAINSVGAGQLQSGSVGSLHIKNAAIGSAHIQDASIVRAHIAEALIDVLNVNALTAVTAKIQELVAGSITTDELYTSIAAIASAQITTANILNANIEWANIDALAAATAQIAKAQITTATIQEASIDWAAITTLTAAFSAIVNASIGSADIDWAHIKDLATDTAIITQGVAGELYISKLAVTEANLVSLTVGELIVKGSDGGFYAVSIDGEGNITTTRKQVGNGDVADVSINAGEKLIEGSVTAATLNVQDIFANNAVIKSLIAANIDVDALFAREATIAALNAADITGNEYLRLMVAGKADAEDVNALGQRLSAAELKITEDAIVTTVTGSTAYQKAQQQIQDDLDELRGSIGGSEIVVGTQTAATAAWTGIASFSELRDGRQITYWLPQGSGGNATLTLTLADGSTTEAIPCYYGSTTRLSTQYTAGNILHLSYRENAKVYNTVIPKGWWADANYDTNYYDRIRFGGTLKAKTAIAANRLVVADATGCFHLAASVPFDISRSILFSTGAISAGALGSNLYLSYPYCYLRSMIPTFTGTMYAACYLVGTLSGSTFTPAETFLTTTIPTQEDGLTYVSLGVMTSVSQCCLYPEHPMYRFVDGEFKPLSQVAYEANVKVDELDMALQTAIEQTDEKIALKADKTVTDSLGNRLETAEASLTTQAGQISAVVSQSQATTNNLSALAIGGRNYVRNSNSTVELNNSGEAFASAWISPSLAMSDDFFTDCKNKLLYVSYYAMCEDLERASSGGWIGFQISYNTATEGSYVYNILVVTATLGSGTKPWTRYRFTASIHSAATSVRSVIFGIQNCKGVVRLRNVQVEYGNRMTDYRPAPEDIALRMSSAESRITQQASQIALKVNTSTYNVDKVYRSSTAPTGTLYGSMLWLDMSLTPNILKRWTGSAWVAVGAQELKTSGITIGPNNVAITTEQFLLQLLDPNNNENVLMEMSASGNVGFKELYADEVISDSVPLAYHGPAVLYVLPSYTGASTTYFRSLRDAVNALNNRYLPFNVTIYLPSASGTVYESSGVQISGISGPGRLMIYGYGNTCPLNTYITIRGCSAHILLQSVTLRESRPLLSSGGRNSYLIECRMNHYVEISSCTLDANGTTYDSVYAHSSQVYMFNTGFYNAMQGLEVFQATGVMKSCLGSCNWAMVAYSGLIFASGTVPGGSRSAGDNGQVYATGVSINYGTAIPTVAPEETTTQYASTTYSWRGSWRTDTLDVIQGVYSDYGYSSSLTWNRGCMWFSNIYSMLYGTTIKSATLTLYRKTGSGAGSAKTVYLCAITNTSPSGMPSIAANYGAIGTIGRGSQITFSIPVAAVQGLANGSFGGLCLYEAPYNFGSSTYSNCYMRMAGTDNSFKPYLTVVYSGGTAVG